MPSHDLHSRSTRRQAMNLFEPPLPEGHARDPVCGMSVDPATATASAEYEGRTYYFCCGGCREKFLAEPARFVGADPQGAAPASGRVAHSHAGGGHSHGETISVAPAKDPVCGMSVDPATAKHEADHAGAAYYFCSARCQEKFVAEPEKYLAPQPAKPAEAAPGVIYTCPMHPQIRRTEPGSCPICGMALEPETPTLETGPSPELVDMTRRFWIGLALAVPVVALEMAGHLPGVHALVGPQTSNWIQFALATPVVLWAGWPFFERGWASIRTRNLNMFTLIAMGTGVAWVYSVIATFAPGVFPPAFRGADGAVPVYFEAGAVITVLVLLGQVLELRARERTGGRDPGASRPCAEDRPPRPGRRDRRGYPAGSRRGRRPPARAARRQSPDRRRDRRGTQRHRRVDGHRRVDAGRQDCRRARDRRHVEPERTVS